MEQPQDALRSLRRIEILSRLDDGALRELASSVQWQSVPARETVVRHLDDAGDVYFIVEGVCRAQLQTPYGRTVPIRELGAGDHFGELAALTGAPRSVTIEAVSDCILASCPQPAFKSLMGANAALANAVATHLARAVIHLTDRLYEFAALEMRFRLYAELLRLARTGRETPDGIVIEPSVTHKALALAIGAQREHVTRELRQLASEGVIASTRRTLTILDIAKLREMVERRGGLTASQFVQWNT